MTEAQIIDQVEKIIAYCKDDKYVIDNITDLKNRSQKLLSYQASLVGYAGRAQEFLDNKKKEIVKNDPGIRPSQLKLLCATEQRLVNTIKELRGTVGSINKVLQSHISLYKEEYIVNRNK